MLILLKDTKRYLLWLWLGFSIPILILLLIQTISGKFSAIEGTAWTWMAVNLFPVLALLLTGAIQNKYPGKLIQVFIFRIIWIFSLLYLLLLLITLLGMTAGTENQSIESYFQQSYKWLLPFQILLVATFFLLYFKKRAIFQADEKILRSHIEKKVDKATKSTNVAQQKAYEQLLASDYNGLFESLRHHFKESSSQDHTATIVVQSRYNEWKNQTDMNAVDPKEAQIDLNQIALSSVSLIEKM